MSKPKSKIWYIMLALFGGIFWGFSGTCGQFLFQIKGFASDWLTTIRMLSSGLILLAVAMFSRRERQDLRSMLCNRRDLLLVICFGTVGIAPCQYCYLTAIQYSNSGTATVLQYLGPVLIMLLVCVREQRLPSARETIAVILAISGTVQIATHGNLQELMISPQSLFWGLLSAVGYVLYAMIPSGLMSRHSSINVTCMGMLFGSIPLLLLVQPWRSTVHFDSGAWLGISGIVIIGTVLAYTMFISSIGGIGPANSSLIACIEPVSATVFSVLWLKTRFELIDLLGFAMIIGTVLLLSWPAKKQVQPTETAERISRKKCDSDITGA